MRTIYIDSENKCHVADDGTMTAVKTFFFDGKCDAFIEGYCCEVLEAGDTVYPWRDYNELDAAQRKYEQTQLADYEANSIMLADLENAYEEGVNSAYD